jgi:hypothetical protein
LRDDREVPIAFEARQCAKKVAVAHGGAPHPSGAEQVEHARHTGRIDRGGHARVEDHLENILHLLEGIDDAVQRQEVEVACTGRATTREREGVTRESRARMRVQHACG